MTLGVRLLGNFKPCRGTYHIPSVCRGIRARQWTVPAQFLGREHSESIMAAEFCAPAATRDGVSSGRSAQSAVACEDHHATPTAPVYRPVPTGMRCAASCLGVLCPPRCVSTGREVVSLAEVTR